jgi:hypothetical protein
MTDRPKFSSLDGSQDLPKDNFNLPSSSWQWKTEWSSNENSFNQVILKVFLYQKRIKTGFTCTNFFLKKGWEYAIDFPTDFRQQFFPLACVRRRKWTRTRIFKEYDQFLNVSF